MDTTKQKIGQLILDVMGDEGVSVAEAAYQLLDARCQTCREERPLDPRLNVPPSRR